MTDTHSTTRVAVITGASSGIGAATARALAAARRVQDELGGADVLVNNAGIMLLGPFSPEQHQDYRAMIEANLLGAITATEAFLDQLKSKSAGDLVNTSSTMSCSAPPTNPAEPDRAAGCTFPFPITDSEHLRP